MTGRGWPTQSFSFTKGAMCRVWPEFEFKTYKLTFSIKGHETTVLRLVNICV